jgi:hypothetical protein
VFDVEGAAYQFELALILKIARILGLVLSPLWLAGAAEVIGWEVTSPSGSPPGAIGQSRLI